MLNNAANVVANVLYMKLTDKYWSYLLSNKVTSSILVGSVLYIAANVVASNGNTV